MVDVTSFFTPALMAKGARALTLFVYALFITGFSGLAYYMSLYKHRAIIIQSRSGQVCRVKWDWVRTWNDKKKGVKRYKLLKSNKFFKPLDVGDPIYSVGRRDLFALYELENGDYSHAQLDDNATIRVPQADLMQWSMNKRNELEQKYNTQSWLERHQTLVLGASTIFFLLIVVWLTFKQIDSIVGQIGGITSSLNNVADRLADMGTQQLNSFPRG